MSHDNFKTCTLGRSQLEVGRLGLGSSYGASATGYERAYEQGCNYFYWGSFRRKAMGDAIRNLASRHREKIVTVLQTYSRLPSLTSFTTRRGLNSLGLEYTDVLLLGWFNKKPSERIIDGALALKERGLVRKIAISCHDRPQFRDYINDTRFDIIMVRYNAAHRGAEREVFPHLGSPSTRPGVVSYTATRWGNLVDPRYTPHGVKTPTAADCYRFALSNPDVDVCLTGPANDAELDANLKALEQGPLSAEEMAWMKSVGDHVHKIASKKRFTNPFNQREP